MGRNVVAASLRATSPGKREKVFVSFARVVLSQSLELHEMDLEFLRLSQLDPKKVKELVLRRRLPHSMEDLFPFVKKSFNIIISEFHSIEMGEREEIRIFLIFLEPFEENDQ